MLYSLWHNADSGGNEYYNKNFTAVTPDDSVALTPDESATATLDESAALLTDESATVPPDESATIEVALTNEEINAALAVVVSKNDDDDDDRSVAPVPVLDPVLPPADILPDPGIYIL